MFADDRGCCGEGVPDINRAIACGSRNLVIKAASAAADAPGSEDAINALFRAEMKQKMVTR